MSSRQKTSCRQPTLAARRDLDVLEDVEAAAADQRVAVDRVERRPFYDVTGDAIAQGLNAVEQALRSEHHPSPAARRDAFGERLDRLAADALVQPAGPRAA